MRRKKQRTEITIETDRVVVIRQRRGILQAWCDGCAAQVKMVRVEAAAVAASVSQRTIYRWVETQRLHFSETPDGLLLICLNSLTAVTSGE